MLKRQSINKSESATKFTSLNRFDDEDFNLGKFRESVYQKISQFNNKDQSTRGSAPRTQKASKQIDIRGSVPSFEDIFKKMIYHKDNTVVSQNLKSEAPNRYSIQNKIESLGECTQNRVSQRSVGMTLHIFNRFSSQQKLDTKQVNSSYNSISKFALNTSDKPIIAQSVKQQLIEKLPLKELIDLRNKIEGSTQLEIQSLSKNYVSELFKLAQIINRQSRKSLL